MSINMRHIQNICASKNEYGNRVYPFADISSDSADFIGRLG